MVGGWLRASLGDNPHKREVSHSSDTLAIQYFLLFLSVALWTWPSGTSSLNPQDSKVLGPDESTQIEYKLRRLPGV